MRYIRGMYKRGNTTYFCGVLGPKEFSLEHHEEPDLPSPSEMVSNSGTTAKIGASLNISRFSSLIQRLFPFSQPT